MFTRVGIPKEIPTDQGSNFTSNLLKEIYKSWELTGAKTSLYHTLTDALHERFNKTLKSMLRKFVKKSSGKDNVRGPLDIHEEVWEGARSEVLFPLLWVENKGLNSFRNLMHSQSTR